MTKYVITANSRRFDNFKSKNKGYEHIICIRDVVLLRGLQFNPETEKIIFLSDFDKIYGSENLEATLRSIGYDGRIPPLSLPDYSVTSVNIEPSPFTLDIHNLSTNTAYIGSDSYYNTTVEIPLYYEILRSEVNNLRQQIIEMQQSQAISPLVIESPFMPTSGESDEE